MTHDTKCFSSCVYSNLHRQQFDNFTHNQCFEQKKKKKHHNFSSENYRFYSREKLQYITWACFRNVSMFPLEGRGFSTKHFDDL